MTISAEIRKNPEQLAALFDSISRLLASYGLELEDLPDLPNTGALPMGAAIGSIVGPQTTAKIAKIDEDEQLVFGWAYVSTDKEGELIVDLDDESIEPTELEKAVYDYVLDFGVSGVMHQGEANGRLVESVMMTPDKAKAMGLPDQQATGWWVGFHIDDADVFAKVKTGEFEMLSIQGGAHELVAV